MGIAHRRASCKRQDIPEEKMTMLEASLNSLPAEILLQIFSYLSAPFLVKHVRLVCKRFYLILNDEAFWRKKLTGTIENLNDCQVLVGLGLTDLRWRSISAEPSWVDVCYREEIEMTRWSAANVEKWASFSEPHYAPIDALKLLEGARLCVTGGRDRILAVWDCENGPTKHPIAVDTKKHTGWIWDVASSSDPEVFHSCAWDSTVVQWSLGDGRLEPITTRCTPNTGLSLWCEPRVVAVGLHVPKIGLIDPRMATEGFVTTFKAHSRAVTGIQIVDNDIISISDDRTMYVTDMRRLSSPLVKVPIEGETPDEGSQARPRTFCRNRNLFYVGDTKGGLHIVNSNNNYKLQAYFPELTQRSITGLSATLSTVVLGSFDKVRIMSMTGLQPRLISQLEMGGEVTSLNYVNGLLAVASVDNTAAIYRPVDGNIFHS